MSGIWWVELERALRNSRYYLVLGLAGLCFAWGGYELTLYGPGFAKNVYEAWVMIYYSSYYQYLLPIAAVLPFADSFLIDRRQGFLRCILIRVAYRKYLAAKILATLFSAALAVGVPLLLLYGGVHLFFPRTLTVQSEFFQAVSNQNIVAAMNVVSGPVGMFSGLYLYHPDLYIFCLIGLAMVMGMLYAFLGLAISAWINNRYVVLAGPFVIFVVLDFIALRAQSLGYGFSPLALLFPYASTEINGDAVLFHILALTLSGALLLGRFAQRRRIVR